MFYKHLLSSTPCSIIGDWSGNNDSRRSAFFVTMSCTFERVRTVERSIGRVPCEPGPATVANTAANISGVITFPWAVAEANCVVWAALFLSEAECWPEPAEGVEAETVFAVCRVGRTAGGLFRSTLTFNNIKIAKQYTDSIASTAQNLGQTNGRIK